ncbi:MAG: OmcA/MtrC family decaheme c-type cytochrome [Rhodoferax sp.]|nr:OmcA/MtrC family decaheme c-type cytochrome [Rhodoferax sp.]
MNQSITRWSWALLASMAIAGCGGGGGGGSTTTATGTAVSSAIFAAAALPSNDSATNSSASFTVLQAAGVPAVTINSPPVVNFTVFSGGKVVTGLTTSNVKFAIAKLVPGTNGDPDQWVNYISKTVNGAAGFGPNGTPVLASATQATTDTASATQLVYNPDGYYTYTFTKDIKTVKDSAGNLLWDPTKTHRIAIQLSYPNTDSSTNTITPNVLVNPYFDFTIGSDGKSIPVTDPSKTRVMTNVASCNSCHEKLALHGGGRVDTQFCVMCHNPGTVDPESGNNLNLVTMVHKIHAGKKIAADGGGDYTIWGYGNSKNDYAEVGFPQDLRNCTKCHSASNPSTPQGDNWKTVVSQSACLTCHVSQVGSKWETGHKVYAGTLVAAGAAATDLTNAQCAACHKPGSNIASETVHWNQNEEDAAKYKMNIESVTYVPGTPRTVTVKYFLSDPTNGNAAYNLVTSDCASTTIPTCGSSTKFGNLQFYLAYQTMVGQSASVTEFSSYNNGGSSAKAYAYAGINDGNNHYTATITLPADTATSVATGTARVVSIGQIKEPLLEVKSNLVPRPAVVPQVLIDTVVQHTYQDVVLSGTLQPRRVIVSNDKCNACHGALGTTSGSNTADTAFHSGARNTVEACVVCHDPNRVSSTVMTNGLLFNESYQFKRMIHGIHGNSKRMYPFTHGNTVVGNFCNPANPLSTTPACDPSLVLGVGAENYGAEVAYPGVGLNCNACHVNNSYKNDLGTLGSVIRKGPAVLSGSGGLTVTADTNPGNWLVISPKAASCTACHDSSTAISHVTSFGGATWGNNNQGVVAGLTGYTALPRETCNDCHASGGFKGVDIVHGQQ